MSLKKTFLVVDDSYIDRLVSSMLIKRAFDNPEVIDLAGGRQALEWLSAKTFDTEETLLIILDIMMPQMNGFEFLDAFEGLEPHIKDQTKIIMLSSTLDLDDINKAMTHTSVKKLLSKPLSANELKPFVEA
jgi:CheY-like chemotaxis protein